MNTSSASDASSAADGRPLRLALVLWNGDVGGAEVFTAALAQKMTALGANVELLFIEQPQPLAARLNGTSHVSLGFGRGRGVLTSARRYAREVSRVGGDGALLIECGFIGAALRAGGYRGAIVAVEHGTILAEPDGLVGKVKRTIGRRVGAWADDVEVAVSDHVLASMRAHPHAKDLRRIYNGIDLERFAGGAGTDSPSADGPLRLGFAARLISGKGADHLISAIALLPEDVRVSLTIAGDGPQRGALEALADTLTIPGVIEFAGLVHDMPAFWRSRDVAVIPSAEFTEACPITPLEAMACGTPVIATANGGLPEIVGDGRSGRIVAPGDPEALARAIVGYAENHETRLVHGREAERVVRERFDLNRCAEAYLELFQQLDAGERRAVPTG